MIISGWRDIDVFGLPKIPKNEKYINVMITSGDGTIIDICQPHIIFGKLRWQQGGMCNDLYPEYRKVRLWRYIKKEQKWSYKKLKNEKE